MRESDAETVLAARNCDIADRDRQTRTRSREIETETERETEPETETDGSRQKEMSRRIEGGRERGRQTHRKKKRER